MIWEKEEQKEIGSNNTGKMQEITPFLHKCKKNARKKRRQYAPDYDKEK